MTRIDLRPLKHLQVVDGDVGLLLGRRLVLCGFFDDSSDAVLADVALVGALPTKPSRLVSYLQRIN